MKKLFTLVLFSAIAAAAAAQEQQPQKITPHATVKNDMQVFVKEGEEAITAFPSAYLGEDVKVNVTLPKGYERSARKYPVVYVLDNEIVRKNQIEETFYTSKSDTPPAVFVTIRLPKKQPSVKELQDFLMREAVPYFELNYKLSSEPQDRVLIAADSLAVKVLEMSSENSGVFKNIALIFTSSTALPTLTGGLAKDVSVWAYGPLTNMIRLQTLLQKEGLKFPSTFAYAIDKGAKIDNLLSVVNAQYLLDNESRSVKKVKGVASITKFSLAAQAASNFWLEVTLKGGYKVNYVPEQVKSAPPFLNWDFNEASLSVIAGAEEGPVSVFGKLPSGKPYTVPFKIEK